LDGSPAWDRLKQRSGRGIAWGKTAAQQVFFAMTSFDLHPQLAADGLFLTDWPLSRVLRMNDRNYPWLILVPRVADAREIIDLTEADQQRLMQEIARASTALKTLRRPHKINVGALGNMVPQLHVHVIGRDQNDAAWPKPVWGVAPADPFPPLEAEMEVAAWRGIVANGNRR
jgi:diadenosine tetraphosphate (Ap4A) HIT family hydrolase